MSHPPPSHLPPKHPSCSCETTPTPTATAKNSAERAQWNAQTYVILNMDCPTEERLIRNALSKLPEIKDLSFNLMQQKLTVYHTFTAPAPIEQALAAIDMQVSIDNGAATPTAPTSVFKKWGFLTMAGISALGAEAVTWLGGADYGSIALAITAIALCGLTTFKKGWIALIRLDLNINALMSIAVTGAMLIGHWPEAAMVMVLFTIAERIEAASLDRARNAVYKLMTLTPERATVLQTDGSWRDQPVSSIAINSRIRVKPGERIALDGTIVAGTSSINQASITGESLPIDKTVGDVIFAGTLNETGSFEYQVTAGATNSVLARIIAVVEAAQGSRANTQRFIDQFARIYTPSVFVVAIFIALIPPLFLNGIWFDWIYKALVLLVIACPCALVISTPVTIVSGLAAAARKGILVKGGVYLEQARKLQWLALDKTGTLTHGKPKQTDYKIVHDANPDLAFDRNHYQLLAASLTARSDHPVSKAIAQHAKAQGLVYLDNVDNFQALLGKGVSAAIDGVLYHLGNTRLMNELGATTPALLNTISEWENQGKTVVILMRASTVLALFAVADTIKESSLEAISQLHQLGIKTMMLTGDNNNTAQTIGKATGIDLIKGSLLPEDKLREIEILVKQGKVGMVGDGINDAPALARADIGFAMGAMGSDTAIEVADVALMDDDLRKIPALINLSKRTHLILVQNIVFALGVKALFLGLTITGDSNMWMAVFADLGTSLLVVFNGLRLLR